MKEDKQATGPTPHRWQRGVGTRSKLREPGKPGLKKKGDQTTVPAPNQKYRKAARRGIYGFRFKLAPGQARGPIKTLLILPYTNSIKRGKCTQATDHCL